MRAVADIARPGFSNRVIYPSVGKSAPPAALARPELILARRDEVTGGGRWTPSQAGGDAWEAFNLIASVAACNAVTSDFPRVTRAEIEDVTQATLETLIEDKLVIEVGSGAFAVCDGGGRAEADKWPGWVRPAPYTSLLQDLDGLHLKPMKPGEQRDRIKVIFAQVCSAGLSGLGAKFPPQVMAYFERALQRGDIALPAWAWAALVNARLPEGVRPISRRTAANRLAELRDLGELVMTRAPRTQYDPSPEHRNFVTIPAAYALPRPGLRGIPQRVSAWRASRKERREPPPPKSETAWRLQVEHWRIRDLEAGWGA